MILVFFGFKVENSNQTHLTSYHWDDLLVIEFNLSRRAIKMSCSSVIVAASKDSFRRWSILPVESVDAGIWKDTSCEFKWYIRLFLVGFCLESSGPIINKALQRLKLETISANGWVEFRNCYNSMKLISGHCWGRFHGIWRAGFTVSSFGALAYHCMI